MLLYPTSNTDYPAQEESIDERSNATTCVDSPWEHEGSQRNAIGKRVVNGRVEKKGTRSTDRRTVRRTQNLSGGSIEKEVDRSTRGKIEVDSVNKEIELVDRDRTEDRTGDPSGKDPRSINRVDRRIEREDRIAGRCRRQGRSKYSTVETPEFNKKKTG